MYIQLAAIRVVVVVPFYSRPRRCIHTHTSSRDALCGREYWLARNFDHRAEREQEEEEKQQQQFRCIFFFFYFVCAVCYILFTLSVPHHRLPAVRSIHNGYIGRQPTTPQSCCYLVYTFLRVAQIVGPDNILHQHIYATQQLLYYSSQ